MTMAHIPAIPVSEGNENTSDRETAVLRALGRLGSLPMSAIHALLFPDRKKTVRYRVAQGLVERNLIWRAPTPRIVRTDGPPRPTSAAYGLTVDGRQHLESLQAEPAGGYDRLVARDRRAPPPSESALVHAMVVSTWCASILDMARRAPMLVGATCETAVTVTSGELRQTLDALLVLVFDSQQRTFTRPGWHMPWFDGEAITSRHRLVRLGLIVDSGRASTTAVAEQAKLWARLAQAGAHTARAGGTLRPVILTPPGSRGTQVASIWADAWPATPAILSSTRAAQHPQYGALWGTYYTVKDVPAQPTTLLSGLVPSVEQWAALIAPWVPGAPA